MLRKYVAGFCRCLRRCFIWLCTCDDRKVVKNIDNVLGVGPPSLEEKIEKRKQSLLRGVKPEDVDKVLDHINRLGRECDPMESLNCLPTDDILCISGGNKDRIS